VAVLDSGLVDLPDRTVSHDTPWRELTTGTVPVLSVLATADTTSDSLVLLMTNAALEHPARVAVSASGRYPYGEAVSGHWSL
jgi:hypothetical protein